MSGLDMRARQLPVTYLALWSAIGLAMWIALCAALARVAMVLVWVFA